MDAARDAGAEVVYGVRLVSLARAGDGRVDGVVIEDGDGRLRTVGAGIVIGADGMRSTVADLVGARSYREGRHSTGVVFGYFSGLEEDGYHFHYRPGVSAGVIPTNDGLTCVFVSVPSERFRGEIRFDPPGGFDRVLAECAPDLAASVAAGRRAGSLRGAPGRPGYFRQAWGPGWALVGDAGYFKDPLTAHGITDALRDAELLAEAAAAGSDQALQAYQDTRDALSERLFQVTDDIASFAWDLESVKELHLELSDEMKREVAVLNERHHRSSAPATRIA